MLAALFALAFGIGRCPSALAAISLETGWLGVSSRGDAWSAMGLGLRVGPARPPTSAPEFGLSVFGGVPESGGRAALGWAGAMMDLDLAHAKALGERAVFASRVGTTLFGSAGEGGGGVAAGLNAGLGILQVPERGVGVRADLGCRLIVSSDHEDLWSFSVGLIWPGSAEPSAGR